MNATAEGTLVLAVHPTVRGFGWALLEGSDALVDWGMASAKAGRDARLVARFSRLLKRYSPSVLVLEPFEGTRSDRAQDLCRTMVHLAFCDGLSAVTFDRETVAKALGLDAKAARHEVAETVALRLEALRHRLPPKRKPWVAQDPRQSLFDAVALALTYFAMNGTT